MLKIASSRQYLKKSLKLMQQNPKLFNQISKALHTLESNPKHPALRLHKLSGSSRWSLSVNMSLRITYEYLDGHILLVNIGTHDEVYK